MHKFILGIFVAPRQAFDGLRDDTPIRPPVMLLCGAAFLAGVAFAVSLDLTALTEGVHTEMPEPRPSKDIVHTAMNVLTAMAPVFASLGVLLALLVLGLCLWIFGKVVRDGSNFRSSLSLASWASMPGLIHSVAATVGMLLTPQGPSNFEHLLLNSAPLNLEVLGVVDATFLGGVPSLYSLTDFWIVALIAIGYQRWHQTHIAQAAAAALVPFALLALLTLGLATVEGPVHTSQ